jgi:hypothetical protein
VRRQQPGHLMSCVDLKRGALARRLVVAVATALLMSGSVGGSATANAFPGRVRRSNIWMCRRRRWAAPSASFLWWPHSTSHGLGEVPIPDACVTSAARQLEAPVPPLAFAYDEAETRRNPRSDDSLDELGSSGGCNT